LPSTWPNGCVGRPLAATRRLYRKQVVDGVYRLDEGALLDEFFHFLHELGGADWLHDVQGREAQRAMVPCVPYVLLYG
jgi:hypothetical protein